MFFISLSRILSKVQVLLYAKSCLTNRIWEEQRTNVQLRYSTTIIKNKSNLIWIIFSKKIPAKFIYLQNFYIFEKNVLTKYQIILNHKNRYSNWDTSELWFWYNYILLITLIWFNIEENIQNHVWLFLILR